MVSLYECSKLNIVSKLGNRWWNPKGTTRGKSEHQRAGCWITSSQSDLKDSATEIDSRCAVRRRQW